MGGLHHVMSWEEGDAGIDLTDMLAGLNTLDALIFDIFYVTQS
jgi:hypothetical protein